MRLFDIVMAEVRHLPLATAVEELEELQSELEICIPGMQMELEEQGND